VQGGGAQAVRPPQAPKRGRGRPRKDAATTPSTLGAQHRTPGSTQRTAPSPSSAASSEAVGSPTAPSTAFGRRPCRDYLLPTEALENPDWGCPPPVDQREGRQPKPLQPLLEEHHNEDWTLENDIDVPIGIGNEDIRYFEEELSDGSEGGYFSADDEDGDEYGLGEDFPDDDTQILWPPEMLHAPMTSRKRRCRRRCKRHCKRKAPIWPPLDDFTCISLAGGEFEHGCEADPGGLDLRQRGVSNGEGFATLLDQSATWSNNGGENEGCMGNEQGAMEVERPFLAGLPVGPGWGALYRDPVFIQQSEWNPPVPQVSVSWGEGAAPTQQGESPTCPSGTPRTRRPTLCTAGPGYTEQEGLIPELDGGEEYFYDNPEVFLPESESEDAGHEEFEADDDGVRRPTPIDYASIKYLFREETWSQCTNEYAPEALPFTGDPPSVKKSY
jgi:hypothetical protein